MVEGFPAKFFCQAFGYPKPRIMWKLNGQLIKKDERIHATESVNGSTLVMKTVNRKDTGKVECQALNAIGVDSRHAFLMITGKHHLTIHVSFTVRKCSIMKLFLAPLHIKKLQHHFPISKESMELWFAAEIIFYS